MLIIPCKEEKMTIGNDKILAIAVVLLIDKYYIFVLPNAVTS